MSNTADHAVVKGLIGGIGLTEIQVYAQHAGPDGQFAGCPHVHAVVDEGYFVLRGTGHVEFHDPEHGMRTLALSPGVYAHFPPLVMHRLVSDGDLAILGLMGSAGLAERGEARIYFGPQVDQDPARYAQLMALPKEKGLAGALERRDAATQGYMQLLELMHSDDAAYRAELRRFFAVHERTMAQRAAEFRHVVDQGPIAWAQQTLDRLDQLAKLSDSSDVLMGAGDVRINLPGSETALGMCGVLRPMLKLQNL